MPRQTASFNSLISLSMFDRRSSSFGARPDWRFLGRVGRGTCPEDSLRVGPELWWPTGAERISPRFFWRCLYLHHCALVKLWLLAGPLYSSFGGGIATDTVSWDPSDSSRGSGPQSLWGSWAGIRWGGGGGGGWLGSRGVIWEGAAPGGGDAAMASEMSMGLGDCADGEASLGDPSRKSVSDLVGEGRMVLKATVNSSLGGMGARGRTIAVAWGLRGNDHWLYC